MRHAALSGTSRLRARGHYTGTFCAMRGSVVGSHCTPLQGTQATACATVEFDLPSTATIAVAIGP